MYRSVSAFDLDEPSSPTEMGSASNKLVCLPIPPFYERGTSFNTMHGARRVLEVITRVLSHHDNCDFKQHAHKLKISGVVYINNRAHSFKVFVWSASEPLERLVEFQRRTGCAKSFHEFFKTVRDQFEEHFYEEEDDAAFRSFAVPGLASAFAGFGRMDSSASASLGEPVDEPVDEPVEDDSTLRNLVEMVASEYVEEKVQALRALCELTGSPVSKELLQQHGVLALAVKALSSRECEVQRLGAAVLLNLLRQFPATAVELCKLSGALQVFEKASSSSCKDTLRTVARIVCSMCQGANANAAFEVASIVRQRCEVVMDQDPRLQHIFQGVPLRPQISCR